jgi:guanosine-3',5'-bis(diphosphate) 3'-pyrophosphohydrolase
MGTRRQPANQVLEPLFRSVRANHPKADLALLERAYLTAEKMHGTQTRKSGDPYITHPLAVTTILADIGMTESTLAAALLHDTVEDTPYTLEQVRQDFGDEVAQLVDGVTKLDKVKYGDSAQAETIRKTIVAMSRDIRVLVIKLAERLHNMRTLRYVKQETQERVARETLDIYAPLAHRLGMNTIKWELEDLAFATLHPKIYDEIVRMVAERAPSRDQFLANVMAQVEADLRDANVKASVTGRLKPYYSIYQKMIVGGREFSDIYDLVGIRVLVEEDRNCYTVLGVLHSRWNPVLGRFKDYVAMPKVNMYQSLHTTVIGPQGKPVELQIRTFAMHRRAEFGHASRRTGEEDGRPGVDRELRADLEDMTWMRQLLDWQNNLEDPGEFLESLRFEINRAEVYVFTPRGDVIALPTAATPVDFAYAVHTEVGHHTIGARVNGRMVPLDAGLKHGDVVEVFTTQLLESGPDRAWLAFVATARARREVRRWYRNLAGPAAAVRGETELQRIAHSEKFKTNLLDRRVVRLAAERAGLASAEDAYEAIGRGALDPWLLVPHMIEVAAMERGRSTSGTDAGNQRRRHYRPASFGSSGTPLVRDLPNIAVRFAQCCSPKAGAAIVGVDARGAGVASIHRADCHRLAEHNRDRILAAAWAEDITVPAWAKSHYIGVRVVYSTRGEELPAFLTTAKPEALQSVVERRSVTAEVGEAILSLSLANPDAIPNAIDQLGADPDVQTVQLVATNYQTVGAGRRERYRDRRAQSRTSAADVALSEDPPETELRPAAAPAVS